MNPVTILNLVQELLGLITVGTQILADGKAAYTAIVDPADVTPEMQAEIESALAALSNRLQKPLDD